MIRRQFFSYLAALPFCGFLAPKPVPINHSLNETIDAQVWTAEFLAHHPDCGIEPNIVLAWFSNAIMCGYDEANRRTIDSVNKQTEMYQQVLDSYRDEVDKWRTRAFEVVMRDQ